MWCCTVFSVFLYNQGSVFFCQPHICIYRTVRLCVFQPLCPAHTVLSHIDTHNHLCFGEQPHCSLSSFIQEYFTLSLSPSLSASESVVVQFLKAIIARCTVSVSAVKTLARAFSSYAIYRAQIVGQSSLCLRRHAYSPLIDCQTYIARLIGKHFVGLASSNLIG